MVMDDGCTAAEGMLAEWDKLRGRYERVDHCGS